MLKYIYVLCFSLIPQLLLCQSNCINDSVIIETNNVNWVLNSNSYGATIGNGAQILTYQYNSLSNFPNAKWISYTNSWTVFGLMNNPDDSATFRYTFNVCQNDSIGLMLEFRRDNYCVIRLDGQLIYADIPSYNPSNYNNSSFLNQFVFLNSGIHKLDFIVYNMYPYTGNNGTGGILGGLITSNSNSLISNNPACANVSCCSNPPVIQITGDTTICLGQSTSLTASAGSANITWSGGINNGTAFAPTGTTSYVVTATDVNGCTNTSAVTVSVLPQPNISITAAPAVVCNGSATTLTAVSTGNITWSPGIQNSIPFIPTATQAYTVTATDVNGCLAQATTVITVKPIPLIQAIATPSMVCAGQQITLNGLGGISYIWNNGILNNTPIVPTGTSTYTVTGTDANGCTNNSFVTVIVLNNPPISIQPVDTNICVGETIVLYALSGINTISWDLGVHNQVPFTPTSSGIYTAMATDVNGCTSTQTVHINVHPQPNIQVLANPGTVICEGNLITLTAIGGLQYQWSGGIQNGIPFLPNQSSTYAVVASDINGCTNQSTVSIQIDTMPNIQVSASNRINCEQLSAVLTASGGQQYTWQPIAGLSASQGAQVIASPTSTNTYTVTVQSGACQDTASISVQVDDITFATISIANVFTPNDDGVNDIVHVLSNTPLFNFMWTIYNRWGQKVFETDQINEGWNGIYNGQPALADTYYYVVQYQTACKKTIKKGDLILIR